MPRQTTPRLPTHPCDGPDCENQVRQTKRSESGLHYCKAKACQAARIANWRKRNVATVTHVDTTELEAIRDDMPLLIRAAVWGERRRCFECGLMNALPGWAHPDPHGQPCYEMGQQRPGGQKAAILAVWPDGTRKYANVV